MDNTDPRMADYQERANKAKALIDPILKELDLNLGAQFDPTRWPMSLRPVPVYLDTKDYVEVAEEPKGEPAEEAEEPNKDDGADFIV